jgi:glycosyltransferase involved in cell wall biosynthesis
MTQDSTAEKKPPTYSIVIPVYRNEESIPPLLQQLEQINKTLEKSMEAVFVVDGSPDKSLEKLEKLLPLQNFRSRLITLSRNFGSFAAIKTGFNHAEGRFIGIMAADLQEPPELIVELFKILKTNEFDVAVGRRESRNDPLASSLASSLYWSTYRTFIQNEMPKGGVDIFATTREVAIQLTKLNESNSSLVGLLMWVGYRRAEVPYTRLQRVHGKSGWTRSKKIKYMMDSVFSFTSLPISIILLIGMIGTLLTFIASLIVFFSWLFGGIPVPGYAAQMLVQLLSSGTILFALGVIGTYIWRIFENSKARPTAIVRSSERF